MSSLNLQQLDVEDKGAVGRNIRHRLTTVCVLGWDSESSFTTNLHTENTNLPAFDDLVGTELEAEGFAGFVR